MGPWSRLASEWTAVPAVFGRRSPSLVYDTGTDSGEYASAAGLAKAERVNDSYLSRILRLTLLAPEIIEAIVMGRQPSTLQLDDLLRPLPAVWARQHSELFASP